MLKKLLKLSKPIVAGVDISDSSIKIVSLTKDGQSYTLNAYARVSLPKNAVVEKEIKEVDIVAASLKEAIALSGTSAKHAAIALTDSLVMTKIISVEKGLSEAEFEEQVLFEADKHIPYPLDEIRFDYYPLENASQSPETKSVFIAASRTESVEPYIQTLEKAGLIPELIDVESFVIRKACLTFVDEFNITDTIGVVDICNSRMTMVIYDQGMPVFSRTELFGNEFLLKEVPLNKLDLINYANTPEELIYEEFKQNFLQHLKRALQFYASTAETKNIEKFILIGSVAVLKGLDELLNAELKIKTIVADPISNAKLKLSKRINSELVHKSSAALMMALGLVLRSFD